MTESEKREAEAAKVAPALKEMLERVKTPMYIDMMTVIALERMVKYRAHINAGFTEQQALELCTK